MTNQDTSVSFPALGSIAVVAVTEPAALGAARECVEQVIDRFDLACSRFRDDSELIALNASSGVPVLVSPLLLEAVEAAVRAARLTDGDVDPTVGEALIALGYDRDFDEIGADGTATMRIASVPGWHTITADHDAGTVCTARGVVLDLGATAKALAADHAAAAAGAAIGEAGVLVSLGGDLSIVGPPPPDGWRVRVTDDHRSDTTAPGQWIALRAGALATSSTTVRRWETDGGPAHHLLDPATGRPVASPWRTVSVTAASCLDANIASTASIIRGEHAPAWLESHALPSRLVGTDGTVLHLAGWPPAGDDLG
ncbi:MAG TPA: FAD:protein FMN transferase [Solirubrobacteraceae bacterium]